MRSFNGIARWSLDENLESWRRNDPERTWIDRCRSHRFSSANNLSLPHRFPSNQIVSVPPSTRRRSPPRLCTLRDRPIRVIYSRVNHNRHGRSIGRLRNDKQEYRPRFSFFFFFPFLFFFFFVSRTCPPTTCGYYLTTTIANRRRVFLTRGEKEEDEGWDRLGRGIGYRGWGGSRTAGLRMQAISFAFAQLLEHLMFVINGGICPERC